MEVKHYVDDGGRKPVTEWLDALRDQTTKRRILIQIDKLAAGNFGDSKAVGEGVNELRMHFGTGYRVYYSRQGSEIVLLLCAGDKATQTRDIILAKEYLENYKARNKKDEKGKN